MPISGKCWRGAYEARRDPSTEGARAHHHCPARAEASCAPVLRQVGKWSNVLCTHDARMLSALMPVTLGAAPDAATTFLSNLKRRRGHKGHGGRSPAATQRHQGARGKTAGAYPDASGSE